MLLPVVQYGHPALRQKGSPIESITPTLEQLIDDMFETMRAAHGVGLAAQQVGQPLLLTVLDVRGVADRPSTLSIHDTPSEVDDFMPLALINPKVTPVADPVAGPEGCLSFPDIYADIVRPESVDVEAWDRHGKNLQFRCGGLLARAIQHELDHLHGILFIDRMSSRRRQELQPELDRLQAATKAALRTS